MLHYKQIQHNYCKKLQNTAYRFDLRPFSAYSRSMRQTTTLDNELLIEASNCTAEEVEIFTESDCWVLAKELQDRGIGEIVGITEVSDSELWRHMAVALPDGYFLDAHGIQTKDQLLTRWSEYCENGEGRLTNYGTPTPERWSDLTNEQVGFRLSYNEDVLAVADKLEEWLEDL